MSKVIFNTHHIKIISDYLGSPNSSPAEMVKALVKNDIIKSDINHNERTNLEKTIDTYWNDVSLCIEDFIIHCKRVGILAE